MGLGLGQSDHIIRMITISVITLSGFHCIAKCHRLSQGGRGVEKSPKI